MERRGFFKRTFSAIVTLAAPRWARAQSVDRNAVHELAAVVLPQSLGRARTDKIADGFMQWFGDYKVGAEIGSGYGNPRTQVTGPNPSTHYADQMRALGSPITRGVGPKGARRRESRPHPESSQWQAHRHRLARLFLRLG